MDWIGWFKFTMYIIQQPHGVGGSENVKVLHDVQFYVLIDSRTSQWTLVTADVYVKDVDSEVSNLLGVDAILQLNRLKVKFV